MPDWPARPDKVGSFLKSFRTARWHVDVGGSAATKPRASAINNLADRRLDYSGWLFALYAFGPVSSSLFPAHIGPAKISVWPDPLVARYSGRGSAAGVPADRKSTRLNSSHVASS